MKLRELEYIWHRVPPNYYQTGIRKNVLQRVWHTGKLHTVKTFIKNTHKNPVTILDVGCASGWFLSQIATQLPGGVYTGIDVYKNAILYGKKQYKKLKLIHADGHALPFGDNTFDVVICNEVLEHVLEPEKVLLEIKRVLKPYGIAIIEMDTGNWLFQFVWYWWTHICHSVWEDAHIQIFNTEKLIESPR